MEGLHTKNKQLRKNKTDQEKKNLSELCSNSIEQKAISQI